MFVEVFIQESSFAVINGKINMQYLINYAENFTHNYVANVSNVCVLLAKLYKIYINTTFSEKKFWRFYIRILWIIHWQIHVELHSIYLVI